jgi:D-serine deaminase-like pyridoxal phosphate-dependent protein
MGYEGHTVTIPDFHERKKKTEDSLALLMETRDLIEQNGMDVKILSGGGTGTYNITSQYPGMTEIQAGSYILMDASYRSVLKDFDCAMTILTTVVSKPDKDRVVLDVGMKSATKESGLPVVKDMDEAELKHLSEEHGKLDVSKCDVDLKLGEKIELIPTHGCTTINLHDKFYGVRNNKLEAVWDISARGKSM